MKAAVESCTFLLLPGTHLEIQGEETECFTPIAAHGSGRLFGRIQWKNGTNTTKDFLCWVVPVGILTEKNKHVAEEPPQASLLKEITSVSNSQENNILYVKTLSTVPLPSQDTHPVQ